MEKVYVITLMYCAGGDCDVEFKVAHSKEKAECVLKDWALEEERTSWIHDYTKDDFDDYTFEDDYFDVQYYDTRTTIWIREKEVL